MRVGLQTILIAFALGSIVLASGSVHLVWWRTATANSTELAAELDRQVTNSVRREWWSQVAAAEATHAAVSRSIEQSGVPAAREAALTQPLGQTSLISALVHSTKERGSIAAIEPVDAKLPARIVTINTIWSPPATPSPSWIPVEADPVAGARAVAYVGALSDGSTLGTFVGMSRFSQFLGEIAVGKTGAALVIDPSGRIVAGNDKQGSSGRLTRVAQAAGATIAARPSDARDIIERLHVEVNGERFTVALSPLHFQGWQFAVIIPEADFLSEIDATTQSVGIGLALVILIAGLTAAMLARLMLVRPIKAIVSDLGHLERFKLDALVHRPSRLTEIDQLSGALARMATGLSSFARFIPVDLVRDLVANGTRAEPGGESADVTVMFADLAGFTGLAEKLGPAVLPLASQFFELASVAIQKHSGIVDKFIGDAVMALWGAPKKDRNAALNACRSALAIQEAMEAEQMGKPSDHMLRVRIGLNSGEAIVGNIGSSTRLNYTALGDGVNLASRLEGVNKIFGTAILIGEETRRQAGEAIIVRELDRIAVYGRSEGIRVYELVGLAEKTARPDWVERYETALAAYRTRDFASALRLLDACLALRTGDGPALLLAERCRAFLRTPPPADWKAVFTPESK